MHHFKANMIQGFLFPLPIILELYQFFAVVFYCFDSAWTKQNIYPCIFIDEAFWLFHHLVIEEQGLEVIER